MYSPSADCPASCVHLDSRALASSSKPLQILQVVLPKCILRGDLSTADDLDLADVLQNISYSRVTSTTSTGRALRAMLLSGIVHTRPVWGVVESTSNLWRLVRFHVDGSAMVAQSACTCLAVRGPAAAGLLSSSVPFGGAFGRRRGGEVESVASGSSMSSMSR